MFKAKKMKIELCLLFVFLNFFAVFVFSAEKVGGKLRIVSLAPSLTETIFALGKGSELVGRTSVDNYPPQVKKVPVVGGFGTPCLESLASVRPDVVVAAVLKDSSIRESIKQVGIKFILLPADSIESYFEAIRRLGEILNCTAEAERELGRLREGLEKYSRESSREKKRPKVYVEIWNNPLMTIGGKSFINDFIVYAGGANIGAGVAKDYFTCSQEWVIMEMPDVIICPSMGSRVLSEIMKRPGWSLIPAVKSRRIYSDLNENLIYRLGPRMLEGIAELRKCINTGGK